MLSQLHFLYELRLREKTFDMSDHWNSIANLLKTPSISPAAKKPDGNAKPPKVALQTEEVADLPTAALPVEPPKSKPEPSRLRSSWDAVATFFGVATGDPAPESEAKSIDSSFNAAQAAPKTGSVASKKSKPSMWGEPVEQSAPKAEEHAPTPRFAEPAETNRETELSRRPMESQDRGRARGRERGPREDGPPRTETRAPKIRDDEGNPSGVPERRSERQQPRRGRQADVRADASFEPLADSELNEEQPIRDDEFVERVEPPRNDRNPRGRGQRNAGEMRTERAPRPDRDAGPEQGARSIKPISQDSADRPARGERSSRPSRGERPGRAERPEELQRAPHPDRGDRPARTERAPRGEGVERSDRGPRPDRAERPDRGPRPDRSDRPEHADRPERVVRPARSDVQDRADATDRPPRVERSVSPRGERGSGREGSERRPRPASAPFPKKESGFGAGIHDDDRFGFVDDSVEIDHEFEAVDEQLDLDADIGVSEEIVERESRPRRRRGRGRRSESRATESSDDQSSGREPVEDRDLEDDDSSEFISRNSRIPSWQDTIGTLVAVNMENHQRNQSSNRPPRGRGPRRDR